MLDLGAINHESARCHCSVTDRSARQVVMVTASVLIKPT